MGGNGSSERLAIIGLSLLAALLTAGAVALLVTETILNRPLSIPEPLPTILGVSYTALFSGTLFFGHTAAAAVQTAALANLAQQVATTTTPAAPATMTSTAPAAEPTPAVVVAPQSPPGTAGP